MPIDMGTAIGYLDLDISGFTRGVSQAQADFRQFLNSSETMQNRIIGLGNSLTDVGKGMSIGLTVPLGAAAGLMANSALEMEEATRRIAKATGISVDEAQKYKDVIAKIYGDNLGESFEDIADVISLVNQQLQGLDDTQVQKVSAHAIQLRDTFDIDVSEGLRAVNTLMVNFGMSAEQAYNAIAIGAQNGLNQNQDLADQISEYATYYASMGASVTDMFNTMYTASQNGIYQIDYINDAYKEFGINAKDTAESVAEGYELLGLNADEMMQKFAAGGDSAQEVFNIVLQKLSEMDDSVKQNQAGVDLFGTKWEDVGQKAIMNISTMRSELDLGKDALGEMNAANFADLSRNLKVLSESFGRILLPYILDITDSAINLLDEFNNLDDGTKELIVKIGLLVAAFGPALTITGKMTAAFGKYLPLVTQLIPLLATLAKLIMSLVNPFTLAVAAVVAFYTAYKNNLFGVKDITDSVIGGIKQAWNIFIEQCKQIPGMVIDGLVNGFKNGVGTVVNAVKELGYSMIDGMKEAIDAHSPSKKAELIGGYWDMGLAKGIYDNSSLVDEGMDYLANLIEKSGDTLQQTFRAIGKDSSSAMYSEIYSGSMKIIGVYEKERNQRVSLMTKGTQQNVQQIQKELQATQQAYQIKMQLYQQELNARTALIDSTVSQEVAALQAQIDAIDALNEKESREEATAEYEKRLAEKQAELELLENEQEAQKVIAEIEELVNNRKKELLQQQRADEQAALREQINEAYQRAEEQKAALQDEYEAKMMQLEMKRDAEIKFMEELQELLQQDLELRKELAETQQEIATKQEKLKTGNLSKEGKIQTTNEIVELKKRESEIKSSMNRNQATFASFTPKLQQIGNEYGNVLTNGLMQYEGTINSFLDGLLRKGENVIDTLREAASMAGSAEEAYSSYESAASNFSGRTAGNSVVNNNQSYNFYSNEKMTSAEISREFRKTQQNMALGF